MILEERVDEGTNFLATEHPEILQTVDLETLDMGSVCDCMLGQSYGHFDTGVEELDLCLYEVVMLGLDVWQDEEYEPTELTPIWKAKIVEWRKNESLRSMEPQSKLSNTGRHGSFC
jgi:hypothetical protein